MGFNCALSTDLESENDMQVTYETKEITYGNATIVIHRPKLTDEEQKKREKNIAIALQRFAMAERKHNEEEKIKKQA